MHDRSSEADTLALVLAATDFTPSARDHRSSVATVSHAAPANDKNLTSAKDDSRPQMGQVSSTATLSIVSQYEVKSAVWRDRWPLPNLGYDSLRDGSNLAQSYRILSGSMPWLQVTVIEKKVGDVTSFDIYTRLKRDDALGNIFVKICDRAYVCCINRYNTDEYDFSWNFDPLDPGVRQLLGIGSDERVVSGVPSAGDRFSFLEIQQPDILTCVGHLTVRAKGSASPLAACPSTLRFHIFYQTIGDDQHGNVMYLLYKGGIFVHPLRDSHDWMLSELYPADPSRITFATYEPDTLQ